MSGPPGWPPPANGLTIEDIQEVVSLGIGGENSGTSIEVLSRFPINVRYPRELRDLVTDLKNLPIVTEQRATVTRASLKRCVQHLYESWWGRLAPDLYK